ncbi:MAG: hypothetical protein ACI91J_002103 [Yoonia sp.]|jgi:hypothetical protein
MSFVKTAVILLICFTSGAANAAESVGFEERILPLFYQRCFSCHSEKEEKPKGGLKLDSVTSIRESGVIVPGQPEKSELLIRISLAHDDDDFMPPPKGGAQPFDAEEFAMMEAWIREGASFGDWVGFEHRQAPLEVTGKSLTMNDVPQLAAKMDELVEQTGGERNPPISNETFLRRIYLDVIGRIPTLAESRVFLDDSNPDKRAKLIQQLLASEGFVSHSFNWKANQLRLDPRGIPGQPGWTYDEWVKEAIRSGMSYDDFVHELITAEGYLWTNGATGFYLRDQGMPLDHMSNLTRLFLGTRIECAQCHDHPFEPISQQDYYQLAAYTYGVSVMYGGRSYDINQVDQWPALKQRLQEENPGDDFGVSLSRTLAPLKRRTVDTEGVLTFGDEFVANPDLRGNEVRFQTLFGDETSAGVEDRREALAKWVTSPRNPRFAKNIANRLWKRVFGVGLIEPVDGLSPVDRAAHPEVLDFISETMAQLEFEERALLAVLYNSRLYQSESIREEWDPGVPTELRGPWLRRLTAEQLWDSMLTLLVPDLDERKGSRGDLSYLQKLVDMSPEDLWDLAGKRLEIRRWHLEYQKRILTAEEAIRIAEAAQDKAEVERLRARQDELRRKQYERPYPDRLPSIPPEPDPRWRSLHGLLRASELTAPSRLGHFLRFFGQSDRREIDASNEDPNVTQSLALMNGNLPRQAADSKSFLRRSLADIDDDSTRVRAIYQTILVRRPTDEEAEVCGRMFETSPTPEEDLVWALLNSPEFLFQQ